MSAKWFTFFSALAICLLLQACIRQPNVRQMFRKPEIRKEVVSNILADHALMDQLLDSMMMHDKTRTMIKYHSGVITMVLSDSVMLQNRMNNMMANESMMVSMIQKMNQQFVINDPYPKPYIRATGNGISMNIAMMKELGTENLKQ